MQKILQKQYGFSFLEFSVILTMLGIIMALSYNLFFPYQQNKKIEITTQKIISQLNYLRAQAIKEQTTYQVWFVDNTLNIKRYVPLLTQKIVYNENYSYRINGSGKIYFYANGRVSFLSLFVSDNDIKKRIVIASTGRIRLE